MAALQTAELVKFYNLNQSEFISLVSVIYVEFLKETAGLRKGNPQPEKLFDLFCANIKMVLTAATPQSQCLQWVQGPAIDENGLANEFLWNHMRRENLLAWQDFYSDGVLHNSKAFKLVNDFVHFMVVRAFKDGAISSISDPTKLLEARKVVEAINRGERKLKAV